MNIPKKNRLRKHNLANENKKDLRYTRTKSFSKNLDTNNRVKVDKSMNHRSQKTKRAK